MDVLIRKHNICMSGEGEGGKLLTVTLWL